MKIFFVLKARRRAAALQILSSLSQMKHIQMRNSRVFLSSSVLILRCHENSVRVTCGKRLASVMKNFNKKIDRKNLNFVNKTAI